MNKAKSVKTEYTPLHEQILFATLEGKSVFIVGTNKLGEQFASVNGSAPLPLDRWLKMTNGGRGWNFVNEA